MEYASDINKRLEDEGKRVAIFNEQMRDKFLQTGDYIDFERYVMSESLYLIEDYGNMIKLIRENSYRFLNIKLLFIGSHLISCDNYGRNDLLEILNILYPYFPDREKAIVSYLNAYDINMNQVSYGYSYDYRSDPQYKQYLIQSTQFDIPFVYNRMLLAEISSEEDAKRLYRKAKGSVKVIYDDEPGETSLEEDIQPDGFIEEFITGTTISKEKYAELCEKCAEL